MKIVIIKTQRLSVIISTTPPPPTHPPTHPQPERKDFEASKNIFEFICCGIKLSIRKLPGSVSPIGGV